MTDRPRRWDDCNGEPCICPKPARRPTIAQLHRAEQKSRAYAFLADRTSQPDGSEWDHDRLRGLVDDLLRAI